jgi:hypothetical protein
MAIFFEAAREIAEPEPPIFDTRLANHGLDVAFVLLIQVRV